jgi:uroporphyrinogen decarboxylase
MTTITTHPFLAACRRERTPYTPVWLMRQAGRYMEEYRRLRAQHDFLELCKRPDLAAEITVTPVERLGVDAAILFADILLPLEPMGVGLEYTKGDGPVIHNPVSSRTHVEQLLEFDPQEALPFVFEAVRKTCGALNGKVPLIGFAGAPFTLASYLIEGGSSRNYLKTKKLIYSNPGAWRGLMERLSSLTSKYLNAQIAAGVEAVQIFDSWAGCLSPDDYERFASLYPRHHYRLDLWHSRNPFQHRHRWICQISSRRRRRRYRGRLEGESRRGVGCIGT